MKKKTLVIVVVLFLLTGALYLLLNKSSTIPAQKLEDRKTVEDYFVEHMRVNAEEAKKLAIDGAVIRVSKNATLAGIVGNLYYYGFIDDEAKFNKLLETSADTTASKEDSIKVGNNSIDVNSNYYLNYSLSDEEIASTLLNKGKFDPNFTQYNYLFMPSGHDIGNN